MCRPFFGRRLFQNQTFVRYSLYRFLEEVVADNMTRAVRTVTRDVSMRKLQRMFGEDDFNAYPSRRIRIFWES